VFTTGNVTPLKKELEETPKIQVDAELTPPKLERGVKSKTPIKPQIFKLYSVKFLIDVGFVIPVKLVLFAKVKIPPNPDNGVKSKLPIKLQSETSYCVKLFGEIECVTPVKNGLLKI
jgi:hypothetical protein